jgi:uncharacterized protein YkwD
MACTTAAAALAAMLTGAACPPAATAGAAAFTADLAEPGRSIDTEQARATLSAYRLNAGLQPLRHDAALSSLARREAEAMARADKPASAADLKRRLAREGVTGAEINVSAGYRSLAEAFSGWRGSAQHDRVMRVASGRRMGIAVAQAPGSKYQVYWTLIVAPE